jgi:hypothetical protein
MSDQVPPTLAICPCHSQTLLAKPSTLKGSSIVRETSLRLRHQLKKQPRVAGDDNRKADELYTGPRILTAG